MTCCHSGVYSSNDTSGKGRETVSPVADEALEERKPMREKKNKVKSPAACCCLAIARRDGFLSFRLFFPLLNCNQLHLFSFSLCVCKHNNCILKTKCGYPFSTRYNKRAPRRGEGTHARADGSSDDE